jgi:class 3 adenylate cyclase
VPPLHEALASYVPVLVLRRLASDPRPLAAPCAETHPAAVLFADISGFTALTELLARQGPAGVERVAAGLNGYFGRLIAIIEAHGGDVVKFAGDALTAVWLQTRASAGSQAASLRAVDCGSRSRPGCTAIRSATGSTCSLRVGVGASRVAAVHLGGLGGRWELVLTGSALAQGLTSPRRIAQPGQVVVSPRVWPSSGRTCAAHPLADGHHIEALACAEPPGDDRITVHARASRWRGAGRGRRGGAVRLRPGGGVDAAGGGAEQLAGRAAAGRGAVRQPPRR